MICRTCRADKPEANFALRKDTGRRRTECNQCVTIRATAWNNSNSERHREIAHSNYARRSGKHPDACRRIWLTPEERALTYYQRHPEIVKAWVKRRAKLEPEKIRAANKKRYAENKAIYRDRHRQWLRNNPHKENEYGTKRRAANKRAQPIWLNAIQKAQIHEFYEIARARTIQTGIKHHVDHGFPLRHPRLCGLHVPWNLGVMTASANCSKRLSLPDEFKDML